MADKDDAASGWTPDIEQALDALIEKTLKDAGDLSPDTIPHRLKQALKGYASGEVDIDDYINRALEKRKKT